MENFDVDIGLQAIIFKGLEFSDKHYILFPFAVLLSYKAYSGSWMDFFVSPEWSLASCIIFGQVASKVSKATSQARCKINGSHVGLHVSLRITGFGISLLIHFGMLYDPTKSLALVQLLIFVCALFVHYKDGIVCYFLEKEK